MIGFLVFLFDLLFLLLVFFLDFGDWFGVRVELVRVGLGVAGVVIDLLFLLFLLSLFFLDLSSRGSLLPIKFLRPSSSLLRAVTAEKPTTARSKIDCSFIVLVYCSWQ